MRKWCRRALAAVIAGPALGFGIAQAGEPPPPLDLETFGALLVLPWLVDETSARETVLSVTNGADHAQTLRWTLVRGVDYSRLDFTCHVIARETTLVRIYSSGGSARADYECTDPDDGSEVPHQLFIDTSEGFVVVTGEDPASGDTDNSATLFGAAHVVDFADGSAVTLPAWNFEGGAPVSGSTDRVYRFDGSEYEEPPAVLSTNFRATDSGLGFDSDLILAVIDGRAGSVNAPNVRIAVDITNEDGSVANRMYSFSGFEVLPLTALSAKFSAAQLGSTHGHLQLTSTADAQSDTVHDFLYDGGSGSDGIRTPAIVGWIVQRDGSGRSIGRRLYQSVDRLVPFPGDVHVFDGS